MSFEPRAASLWFGASDAMADFKTESRQNAHQNFNEC